MSLLVEPDGYFRTELQAGPDRVILAVHGEVDIATAEKFESALDDARQRCRRLLVDLSGITFMDSTGLTLLMRTYRNLGSTPDALVVRAPRPIRRLLNIGGLDRLIEVEPV